MNPSTVVLPDPRGSTSGSTRPIHIRCFLGRYYGDPVDLGPADHRALQSWCTEAAEELGRARVTGQDVLSALVAKLVRDDELSVAIRRDLRANQ